MSLTFSQFLSECHLVDVGVIYDNQLSRWGIGAWNGGLSRESNPYYARKSKEKKKNIEKTSNNWAPYSRKILNRRLLKI